MFIADDAFALTVNMLKPYAKKQLSVEERIFNYRLSRVRRIIENTFGILTAMWRIFRTQIHASLKLTEQIIVSTVCLHNWLRSQQAIKFIKYTDIDNNSETNFRPLENRHFNSTNLAKETRNNFAKYFNNEGAVEWQINMI